jgi:hypothetical protein
MQMKRPLQFKAVHCTGVQAAVSIQVTRSAAAGHATGHLQLIARPEQWLALICNEGMPGAKTRHC